MVNRPGIHAGSIDPATGLAVKRYVHYIAAELGDAAIAEFGPGGLVDLPPGVEGIIIRAGHVCKTGSNGTGVISALLHKTIGEDNGKVAGVTGVPIPIMAAAQAIPANTPNGGHTLFALSPDDSVAQRLFTSITDTGDATEDTLDSGLAVANYYVNSLMKRQDTGEKAVITAYTAGKAATHAAWTRGTADAPTGTPASVFHDNLIVHGGDFFSLTLSGAGAGTQPVGNWFYVEVLERSATQKDVIR